MATRYVDSYQRTTKTGASCNFPWSLSSNSLTVVLGEAPWVCYRIRFRHQSFHNGWQSMGLYHRRNSPTAGYPCANSVAMM